jgi:KDO2-lipid IV(A) lauroyltransferase
MTAEARRHALAHPRHWPTWALLGMLRAAARLPAPVTAAAGSALGLLLYALHAPRRRVAQTNIARCFPELGARERRRLARRHFRVLGASTLEVAVAWWASPARLRRHTRVRGRAHLEAALGAKRNVILLAPHFVGLETGGIRLSLETPLVAVFDFFRNPVLHAVVPRARARFGLKLVANNQSFTALVRALKSGIPLYYLPDQDAGRRNSVFAPFFGVPAATFTTLARLARMTDAVVIPCATYRRARGRYEIVFYPPLADFPGGDALADATRMNAAIEQAVRAHPEQYFWVHKRFKTRPPGEPPFY